MNTPALTTTVALTSGAEQASPSDEENEPMDTVAARLREACQDAWTLIDALGTQVSDEARLEILRGPKFAAAAFSVRCALVFARNLHL